MSRWRRLTTSSMMAGDCMTSSSLLTFVLDWKSPMSENPMSEERDCPLVFSLISTAAVRV